MEASAFIRRVPTCLPPKHSFWDSLMSVFDKTKSYFFCRFHLFFDLPHVPQTASRLVFSEPFAPTPSIHYSPFVTAILVFFALGF